MFKNYYRHCHLTWEDVWESTCNDKCPNCGREIEPYTSQELEEADLIASGYEWYCPDCEEFNSEIEIPYYLTCRKCGRAFSVGDYHHAMY